MTASLPAGAKRKRNTSIEIGVRCHLESAGRFWCRSAAISVLQTTLDRTGTADNKVGRGKVAHMLTHAHRETIRRSWKLIEPVAESVPDLFYRRLFDIAPQYRSLFSDDMTAQKRKLMTMLAFVVKAIDWPEEFWTDRIAPDQDLVMMVAALGRRHAQLYRV